MTRLFLASILMLIFVTGCIPATNGDGNPTDIFENDAISRLSDDVEAIDPFIANNLTIIDEITINEDTGYRAEDENGKPFLILQGSFYNMGYQMGYLMPEAATWTTTEYPYFIGARVFKIKPEDAPRLIAFLANEVLTLCHESLQEIPQYLQEEMHGVADGAAAKGFDVTFDDVLLLNQGFDGIYAMLFTGQLPSFQSCVSKLFFPESDPDIMGCNNFVISGNATINENVYHGRDFMFNVGGKYQDYACMITYLPDTGYPFSTVSAPGFVGHPTYLNSKGLSIGIDTIKAACTRSDIGLSSGLITRDIIHHCSNLDEAVAWMKSKSRGVPFNYTFADDEYSETYTNGVVLEAGMSEPEFTGPDLMPKWQLLLLYYYINKLDDTPLPEQGIMTRNQKWTYPSAFEDIGFVRPSGRLSWIYFPPQIETWPDVVITTNHYIIPRMVFTQFTPWIHALEKNKLPDSKWRYEHLFECIALNYGSIDFYTAAELVAYLNPNGPYGGYPYYTPSGPVKGHHAIIDNKEKVIEALFGYYGTDSEHKAPWARIELQPFIDYFYKD